MVTTRRDLSKNHVVGQNSVTLPGVCVSVLHGHGRGVRVVMVVVVVMGGVGVVGGHGGVVAQAGGGHGSRRGRVGGVAVLPDRGLAGVGRDDGRDADGRRRRRGHHGVGGGVHGRVERMVVLDLRHGRRGVRRVRQGAARELNTYILHSFYQGFSRNLFHQCGKQNNT